MRSVAAVPSIGHSLTAVDANLRSGCGGWKSVTCIDIHWKPVEIAMIGSFGNASASLMFHRSNGQ